MPAKKKQSRKINKKETKTENSNFGAYLLIGLGAIFLLNNLGLSWGFKGFINYFWPLILIIAGYLLLKKNK